MKIDLKDQIIKNLRKNVLCVFNQLSEYKFPTWIISEGLSSYEDMTSPPYFNHNIIGQHIIKYNNEI